MAASFDFMKDAMIGAPSELARTTGLTRPHQTSFGSAPRKRAPLRDMQKPRGKDPPAGDFSSWGRPLPPGEVDEALINESFEQFDFPADETDDLNDETFGDVGPLSTRQKRSLPALTACR